MQSRSISQNAEFQSIVLPGTMLQYSAFSKQNAVSLSSEYQPDSRKTPKNRLIPPIASS